MNVQESVTIKKLPMEYPPCPEGTLASEHKSACLRLHQTYLQGLSQLVRMAAESHAQIIEDYESALDNLYKEEDEPIS